MREIKFRVWDTAMERFIPSEFLFMNMNGEVTAVFDSGRDVEDFTENNQAVISQYTGLKDKNGREIYEGDIIESEEIAFNDSGSYEGMKRVCGSVVFMSGKFIFHKTTGALADVSTASIYNKVIGNIYENLELLP